MDNGPLIIIEAHVQQNKHSGFFWENKSYYWCAGITSYLIGAHTANFIE